MATKKLQILGEFGEKIYKQNEAPTDAEDGALWLDLDEESIDIEAIYSYIDNAIDDTYGKGESISSSADLNDYNAIGKYYANANSIATSLKNCPTKQNFVMWVFVRTNSALTQIIIDLTGKMFIRSRSSSTFNSWQTYLTDKNVATLLHDIVVEELAKYGQIGPAFANSIAECTDTTKLYVLPDGYIYAYMTNANVPLFTDQLKNAVDTDGTKYNGGKGYKEGWRFNSSKQEVEAEGQLITGYIPYTPGQVIRVAGYTNSATPVGYFQACSSFGTSGVINHIQTQQLYGSYEGVFYEPDPAVPGAYVLTIDPKTLSEQYLAQALNGGDVAYIRVNLAGYNLSALKVTLNEEISYGAQSAWMNTGHAFVPADYEDRIIELETVSQEQSAELETHKKQIAALADGDDSLIPDYVIEESEAVIDRVIAAQGNRTFTFAALTDFHYGVWSYSDGVTHACQAVKYIGERIGLDAVAVLGDYTDGSPNSGYADAIADFKAVNTALDDLQSVPNLRLAGNHDAYAENPALTMRYINAYSDDVVWGSASGGYYYRDFVGYKLRVIGLNTNMRSTEQYNWFVTALDLSDKEDVADWSILVLSHHPMDFIHWDTNNPNEYDCFGHIVDGYRKGENKTVNGTFGGVVSSVTYDFTNGKNAAKLIGNIHGHIHNFKVDNVHVGWIYEDTTQNVKSDVLRMATPNICYNRENEYGGVWAEEKNYNKTLNSAKDTSFCVYCIDLDEYTIKAICYGAGYDREASYAYTNSAEPPAKKNMSSETWTFELEDGSVVTKQVVVMV